MNFERSIKSLLESGPRAKTVFGLRGSARALFVSLAFMHSRRSLFIISSTREDAYLLREDLRFFLSRGFSIFDISRTDPGKVHRGIKILSDRQINLMRCLYKLIHDQAPCIIISTPDGLTEACPGPNWFRSRTRKLHVGDVLTIEESAELVIKGGYNRSYHVAGPGDFSIRGNLFDLYPPQNTRPIRIELLGDEISTIREFDPSTQRSLKLMEEATIFPFRFAEELGDGRLETGEDGRHEEVIGNRLSVIGKNGKEKESGRLEKSEIRNPKSLTPNSVRAIHELPLHPASELNTPNYSRRDYAELSDNISQTQSIIKFLPDNTIIIIDDPGLKPEPEYIDDYDSISHLTTFIMNPLPLVKPGSHESWELGVGSWESEDRRQKFVSPSYKLQASGPKLQAQGSKPADGGLRPTAHTPNSELRTPNSDSIYIPSFDNSDLRSYVKAHPDDGMVKPLTKMLNELRRDGYRVALAAGDGGQAERLWDLLTETGEAYCYTKGDILDEGILKGWLSREVSDIPIFTGRVSSGFKLPDLKIALIVDRDIFGVRRIGRDSGKLRTFKEFASLDELRPDEHVVHIDYGVGVYRGLTPIEAGGVRGDFMILEYAGGDMLYLPVERINCLQRYIGLDGSKVRLDKLGGSAFGNTKKRIKKAIKDIAKDLLDIYAAREVLPGYSFSEGGSYLRDFEATFEYEETPDQGNAIEDVMSDMETSRPMDRLVCGDVGYGKTEVAIRASFKAALDGKQAAVLCPTTLLAHQHYHTFSTRFRDYPVEIEMLSRFRSRGQQNKIVKRLKDGGVDIIIGTHRLLGKDVEFKDLGLLVVDEEQRFGVAHKERLKSLKKTVDCLTLTATPIPRTLQISMLNIRDISIIGTPPEERKDILTCLSRFDDGVIKDAIRFELDRGGQVFFVHNRVKNIMGMHRYLNELVPQARIGLAHGQMEEALLEEVMVDFLEKRYQVLLCTSIIEAGLDIPTANTIIINRADRFGLAQLHQLRGRVGRAGIQARAYLLLPKEAEITANAEKRMEAIQDYSKLGSGFRLAAKDLEIRGGGNILGRDQSGHIARVGYGLFLRLIEDAVADLKGQDVRDETTIEPEVKLGIESYIPEGYMPDVNDRLIFYRRIQNISTPPNIEEMRAELIDRFGEIPAELNRLLMVGRLKIDLRALRIDKLELSGKEVVFSFDPQTTVSPERILELVHTRKENFSFTQDNKLKFRPPSLKFDFLNNDILNILERLH